MSVPTIPPPTPPGREGRAGRLPDFVVIGATKAGTTSLDFYLNLHPEIHMARPKEPGFFIDRSSQSTWNRGVDWYRSLFVTKKRVCGECTPGYSSSPSYPGVAARMASVVPAAKLIYLVREPYARLRSEYLMTRRLGIVSEPFPTFLERRPAALDRSMYGRQYREYHEHFPADRILVVESERLERDRTATLARIFRFLGADERFSSLLFRHRRNAAASRRYPDGTGRKILASAPVRWAKGTLHSGVYHHLSNLLLMPFSEPPPSTELPPEVLRPLLARLRAEVQLLRESTGLDLPSIEPPADP
jgi:hypothetical protein